MLPVQVAVERDGYTENLTLLGTYFAKQVSFGKEEFTTGVRSTHLWWKVSGRGRKIPRAMFCWESGWRRGFQ